MFVEAKAVLDVVVADDRPTAEDPTALVLRAVANLMFDRIDSALKDLTNPYVGNQQDAQLWRALAYARQGKWAEAREGFRNVEGAMGTLPIELQLVALRDALRVAIEVGDFASATRRLNDLEMVGVPADLEPSLSVLTGRLAEGLGRKEDALSAYHVAADVAESSGRRARQAARNGPALCARQRQEVRCDPRTRNSHHDVARRRNRGRGVAVPRPVLHRRGALSAMRST